MKGRIGIFETFCVNDEVANLMGEKVEENELRKIARKQGMTTMKQDGILKVLEGITTLEEIERVTEDEILEVE